jgi:hypothetical protein
MLNSPKHTWEAIDNGLIYSIIDKAEKQVESGIPEGFSINYTLPINLQKKLKTYAPALIILVNTKTTWIGFNERPSEESKFDDFKHISPQYPLRGIKEMWEIADRNLLYKIRIDAENQIREGNPLGFDIKCVISKNLQNKITRHCKSLNFRLDNYTTHISFKERPIEEPTMIQEKDIVQEKVPTTIQENILVQENPLTLGDDIIEFNPTTFKDDLEKDQLKSLLKLLKDIKKPLYETSVEFSHNSITEKNRNELLTKYDCRITSIRDGNWIKINWVPNK